jgi:hypothetical protein
MLFQSAFQSMLTQAPTICLLPAQHECADRPNGRIRAAGIGLLHLGQRQRLQLILFTHSEFISRKIVKPLLQHRQSARHDGDRYEHETHSHRRQVQVTLVFDVNTLRISVS